MAKLENKLKLKRIKIGVLGGTFDPAHRGHLEISKQAKKRFGLKNIIWAITKQNPFKGEGKSNLRSRMQLEKKINEIYFIMGADNLINFHKWYKWKSILKKCNILVFDRQGYKAKSLKSVTFNRVNNKKLTFVNFNKVNISSSQLRKV